MAPRKPKESKSEPVIIEGGISLADMLSQKTLYQDFQFWIVGDTPLIVHSWSEKAKQEMLGKQTGAVKGGKQKRDPERDFVDSLYKMEDGGFGFPATGVKNCILSAAHKDKGVARSAVMAGLWLNSELERVTPAYPGAICDMPLVRIYGGRPENREDMVKIGSGLNKIANLAYRGQFSVWAMHITGRYNATVLTGNQLAFLVQEAGMASGLGEWRNERKGMFGAFHIADRDEEKAWNAFRDGKGPLPLPANYTPPRLMEGEGIR